MNVSQNKWVVFKWLSMVLNVLIELCQAIVTQENGQGKINRHLYLRICVVTSCCCLMVSIIEIIREWKESKVVWRQRSFYWQGQLKGRFSVYFGIISSVVQLVINLVAVVRKNNVVRFDILPLLLSFGYLIAAMVNPGEQTRVICRIRSSFPLVSVSIKSVSVSQGATESVVATLRPKMVTLQSSDGENFEVNEAVAMQSELIEDMIKQGSTDNDSIIPLPQVSSQILSKVVEYMIKEHAQDEEEDEEEEGDEKEVWDAAQFVKSLNQDTLYDLILAAHYLEIESLLDLTCEAGAKMLDATTPEGAEGERGETALDGNSGQLARQLIRSWLEEQENKRKILQKIRTHAQVNRAAFLFQAAANKEGGKSE